MQSRCVLSPVELRRSTVQNRTRTHKARSAAFQKCSGLAMGFPPRVGVRVCGADGLVRWIGCKILATLEIVVRKKCPDNFRMHKIFGTLK